MSRRILAQGRGGFTGFPRGQTSRGSGNPGLPPPAETNRIESVKAVILDAPESMIRDRRRRGIDRRDEVWEGVYHLVPPPSERHQSIVTALVELLGPYARRHGLGFLRIGLGVRDPRSGGQDYRIPEWIFVRAERGALLHPDSGYVDEGPDALLEVRSPGDETDEKLPFYEKVGAHEALIVDPDTRNVQVLRLLGGRLAPVSPNADGWTYSESLRAFFRTGQHEGKPALRVLLELDRTEHLI